jgi:tetratricopeptide (TPR) repeat protein
MVFILSSCQAPIEQRVQQGLDLSEQKNFAAAISHFDQLITDEPNSAEAWNGRGLAKKASGDPDGALKDYDHAIQLDSSGAYLFNNRGTLLWEKRDLTGALSDFDRSLVLDPKYDLALYNRAQIKIMNGDISGALGDLDKLKSLVGQARYPDFWFHRGYANARKGNFNEAEADLSRHLATVNYDPLEGLCYEHRGMNRLNLDLYDSAYADLRRAESLGRRDKDVFYYQGYALSNLKRWTEAKEATLKALELAPSFPEAKWGLGRCLEELGQKEEACQAYRDAIALGHEEMEGTLIRVCK